MTRRRTGPLLLLALFLGGGALLLIRTRSRPRAPALEQPAATAEHPQERSEVQVESREGRTGAVGTPPAPAPAPEPPAELRELGAQRGWTLPVGKAWWTDPLINPSGADPAGAQLEALQAQVRHWSDQLVSIKVKRKQRRDAYCNERIAAGLAVADPEGQEDPPKGKEFVIVNTHTPENPGRFWRIDLGPGDDPELDRFDRQLSSTWCEAVLDLRRAFAEARR